MYPNIISYQEGACLWGTHPLWQKHWNHRTTATNQKPGVITLLSFLVIRINRCFANCLCLTFSCAALYPYTPRRAEELGLQKGEMVGVYGKYQEGWLRGLSLRTGKVGILPGNYVTPVLRYNKIQFSIISFLYLSIYLYCTRSWVYT